MKKSNGFTLTELMIAVILVGIVATIAVPSFINLTISNKLTTAANEMLGAVKYTRMEAIKRNNTVAFCQPTADMTSLNTACSASTTWTQWGAIARNGDGSAMTLQSRALDGMGGKALLKNSIRLDFNGSGIASTGTAPYTGIIADIYSNDLDSDNHRCIAMTGGSSVRVYSKTGDCP